MSGFPRWHQVDTIPIEPRRAVAIAHPSKGVRIQQTTRIPVDLHRRAALRAASRGWTLNDMIVACLRAGLDDETLPDPVGARSNLSLYDEQGNKIGRI